jgi:hypothetical protein
VRIDLRGIAAFRQPNDERPDDVTRPWHKKSHERGGMAEDRPSARFS